MQATPERIVQPLVSLKESKQMRIKHLNQSVVSLEREKNNVSQQWLLAHRKWLHDHEGKICCGMACSTGCLAAIGMLLDDTLGTIPLCMILSSAAGTLAWTKFFNRYQPDLSTYDTKIARLKLRITKIKEKTD